MHLLNIASEPRKMDFSQKFESIAMWHIWQQTEHVTHNTEQRCCDGITKYVDALPTTLRGIRLVYIIYLHRLWSSWSCWWHIGRCRGWVYLHPSWVQNKNIWAGLLLNAQDVSKHYILSCRQIQQVCCHCVWICMKSVDCTSSCLIYIWQCYSLHWGRLDHGDSFWLKSNCYITWKDVICHILVINNKVDKMIWPV